MDTTTMYETTKSARNTGFSHYDVVQASYV